MAAMTAGAKSFALEVWSAERWLWLAVLAILSPGLLHCSATARGVSDPVVLAVAESASEQRLVALVQGWFAALERRLPEASSLSDLLPASSFEVTWSDGKHRSRSGTSAWLSDLRTSHRQIEYRIGEIRVDSLGKGLYEAHFEFDRQAVDEAGTPRIARREHTWLVRDSPGDPPQILRIDERPLLPFPGTGPQIVCY